jgi:hypothetical protein
LSQVRAAQEEIRQQVEEVRHLATTLDASSGTQAERRSAFAALRDQFQRSAEAHHQHLAKIMASFEPGLFVGGDVAGWPQDNLDLERWFRWPKSHARHIHGRRHAGVRLVQEGATLVLTLDAHQRHEGLFTAEELHRYRHSRASAGQRAALRRRKVMRRARSKKKRRLLLAELERRYLETG